MVYATLPAQYQPRIPWGWPIKCTVHPDGHVEVVPITAPAPVPTPVPTPGPVVVPVPASWVTWARHVLTLKSESHATQAVAREIIAAAGG